MSIFSRRSGFFAAVSLAALSFTAGASAQENLVIFKGDVKDSGISQAPWGSGAATLDTQVHQEGLTSIKIVTQGLYQGASLAFAKPFDLGPFVANKNSFLQFTVYLPDIFNSTGGSAAPPRGPGGPPGGFPGGRPPGPMGAGGPGGFPGGKPPGPMGGGRGGRGQNFAPEAFSDLPDHGPSPGGFAPQPPPPFGGGPPPGAGFGGPGGGNPGAGAKKGVAMQKARTLENLRIVLLTTNGATIEFMMPVIYTHGADAWRQFNIPVSAIPGIKAEDAQIKEVRVFGDAATTLWLGGIHTVTDTAPLTIAPLENQSALPKNANYRYAAKVTGGASALRVTWDFDAKDGIQEDRVGQSVTYAYHKPTALDAKDYIVTVTVSDVYGIKAPAQQTFKIHVTE